MEGRPRVTKVIGKMFAQSTKVKKPVDVAQQMIGIHLTKPAPFGLIVRKGGGGIHPIAYCSISFLLLIYS
jgi:hypothetical protein